MLPEHRETADGKISRHFNVLSRIELGQEYVICQLIQLFRIPFLANITDNSAHLGRFKQQVEN